GYDSSNSYGYENPSFGQANYEDDDYTSRRSQGNSGYGNDSYRGYERGQDEFSGRHNDRFESFQGSERSDKRKKSKK
ncbi:MAG: hypothetical protein V4677_12040, partial [Bacteroidota bacterium]